MNKNHYEIMKKQIQEISLSHIIFLSVFQNTERK